MSSMKRKGVLNILLSIFYKIITVAVGLLLPKLFITNYSSNLNGLQSSVTQIFGYIALLEAGVGSSALQMMFAPAAKGERDKENSYISAVSRYYNKIGFIYFIVLFGISLIYALFVQVDVLSFFEVVIYVVISGALTGINFFYLSKLKLIISAEGDEYIVSVLSTIVFLVSSAIKIILISLRFNIVLIQAIYLGINLVFTLVYYLIAKKKYKWLTFSAQPDYACVKQKNSVLVHKVASLIFQNIDILLLTVFCDLETVSIYTIYKMVVNTVNSLVATFGDSLNFIFGQKFNTEESSDKPKYKKIIDIFNVYYSGVAFSLYTVMFILMIPFVRLYTSDFDIQYVYLFLPWLYISIEVLTVGREAMLRTIDVAGHFKKTQWRAVTEAIINLVVSIVAILIFKRLYGNIGGLYGALTGTIVAMLYRTIDINIYANKRILNRKPWKSFWCIFSNILTFAIIYFGMSFINISFNSYGDILLKGMLIGVIVLLLYVLIQSLLNPKEFKTVTGYMKSKIAGLRSKKRREI